MTVELKGGKKGTDDGRDSVETQSPRTWWHWAQVNTRGEDSLQGAVKGSARLKISQRRCLAVNTLGPIYSAHNITPFLRVPPVLSSWPRLKMGIDTETEIPSSRNLLVGFRDDLWLWWNQEVVNLRTVCECVPPKFTYGNLVHSMTVFEDGAFEK